MKRTPLQRKTALRSKGPSLATKRSGGKARGEQIRRAAGVPDDAPKNAAGESCVERVCPVCEKPFLVRWAEKHRRRTCSISCAAIAKRSKGKDRKGRRNPNYRHGRRVGHRDREAERVWYAAASTACQHPGCLGTSVVLAQHHVVYEQKVRREGGPIWDARNSLTLCESCHTSHHRRGTWIVPLSALRDANFDFAVDLLGQAAYDYLRRRYVGDDPRLDRILDSPPKERTDADCP